MNPPRICFLGLYQNMVQITTDSGMPLAVNMLGLTDQVVSNIFPFSLEGLGLALAIFEPGKEEKITLIFRDQTTQDQFEIHLMMAISVEGNPQALNLGHGWVRIFGKAPKESIVKQPGQFGVFFKLDASKEEFLGYLNFHPIEPPPLSPAVIEAIKADPFAKKFVRYKLLCNKCQDQLKCYTGIERSSSSESSGWIWQGDLPDTFFCRCGLTSVPLIYLKKGLHAVLSGAGGEPHGMATMISLYEQSALQQYCREFQKLLDSKPKKEEVLQVFLDKHKVFLNRFSAIQILTKPPILSKFNADFVILNNRKELLLIEIERSTIRLLKKGKNTFGVTADLQHAIDQVHSWRQLFDDYRDAALANIDLDKKDVAKIRGVVIAGRTPENVDEARYLRSLNLGVELFTYDDLISDVVESIKHISAV